ncbi:MAG: viperin family antiviral radical SAM protein [Peptostreptococcaceae bacterium]
MNYVINLHILEGCNFKCKYCFAKFGSRKILDIDSWKIIIDNIVNEVDVKRFNIAGGEPMLYPQLQELIDYIHSKNIDISIITNGYLLSSNFLEKNKDKIETIGISIDSFDEDMLRKLDCTYKGNIFDFDKFKALAIKTKELGMNLKINTVVSKYNYDYNLKKYLDEFDVDRWKILKMKVFKDDKFDNSDLDIDENSFNQFIENNQSDNLIIEYSLKNSYIIIDSNGYLLDNSSENYIKIANLQNEGFIDAFKKLDFDLDLYNERY